MLLLMSAALSLTVSNLPIVVQDFDGSSASNNFIDAFRASISFHVVAWPVDKSAEEALASNAARAVLIIPPHFGRDLARGVQTPVQFMVDASDANTAKLVTGDASLIAAAYNRQLAGGARPRPCRPPSACGSTPASPQESFTAPAFSCWPSPCSRRCSPRWPWPRRPNRRRSFRSTSPASPRTSFCWARFSPSWPSRSARHSSCLRFLFTYFGLGFAGDPTPVILATILYTFCVASFGTMVGAIIPSQTAALQTVALGGFLLVFLLSGLMFPIQNIPIALRWISNFVWGRYYIEIVRDALLQGGGWPAVWYKVIFIAVIGSIFYSLAWRGMRRMQVKA